MVDAEQPPQVERRRSLRYSSQGPARAGIMAANSVRVVDISVGGVLLTSPRRAAIGSRARLTLTLGGSPLATEIEIRRVVELLDRSFSIGASFVGISPAQKDTIESFART